MIRLGRWLSVDQLAKRYPQISPYAFVANSPILAIDPDGREIVLYYYDRSTLERKSYIFNPNESYTGDVPQLKMFYAMYEELKAKDAADIITDLGNDKENTLDLIMSWESETGTDWNEDYKPTEGKDFLGTITWDPNEGLEFKDVNGGKGRISPAIVLIHELSHLQSLSELGIIGFFLRLNIKNTYYDNSEELSAVGDENRVAEKLGEGIRNHHRGYSIETAGTMSTKTTSENAKEEKKKMKQEKKQNKKNN